MWQNPRGSDQLDCGNIYLWIAQASWQNFKKIIQRNSLNDFPVKTNVNLFLEM